MNSFNHWALGSVGQWLFERVAGLALAGPGWGRVRFSLVPTPGLEWAEASRKTPGGKASVRWERQGANVRWTMEVPANCTAEFVDVEGAVWAEGGDRVVLRGGRAEAPAGRYVAIL
jgi:alpha-L-rhamnosidase